MIITYLTCDTPSLLTCSLTCYTWYIAAVPLLHKNLTVSIGSPHKNRKLTKPNLLLRKHKLGLLPLVKTLWFRGDDSGRVSFSPKLLNRYTLRPFCASNNVNKLRIDHLDIPSFMPRIQRYFGHLAPTLQYLSLYEPKGSSRQIIYFIAVFRHLEDLLLTYDMGKFREEPADDLTPIPPFVPPLRGWLVMINITGAGLVKDMINLFGGIRFRRMNLFNVNGMRLLLNACAETLETVVLDPTDPRGKCISLKDMQSLADNFVALSSPQDFDLSMNRSLWALQVWARAIDAELEAGPPNSVSNFFKHMLSTMTSPEFPGILVLYEELDFCGIRSARQQACPPFHRMTQAEREEETARHHRRFEIFREVYRVHDFSLALCAGVLETLVDYSVGMLKEAIATEKKRWGFDSSFPEPSVIDNPQETCADRQI